MNCMICGEPSHRTIKCDKHGIEFSLCDIHVDECKKCSNCNMPKVMQ